MDDLTKNTVIPVVTHVAGIATPAGIPERPEPVVLKKLSEPGKENDLAGEIKGTSVMTLNDFLRTPPAPGMSDQQRRNSDEAQRKARLDEERRIRRELEAKGERYFD